MTARYIIASLAGGVALLLSGCGMPIVSESMVNHAYEGRTKNLVVYNHLYDGLSPKFTSTFDAQFKTEMERCGVAVSIIDANGVELNWAAHVSQIVRDSHADTVLIGNWSRRTTSNSATTQDSLFTLAQMHRPGDTAPNLGEVWKAEMKQNFAGLRLSGPTDGELMAMLVADQMERDRMLLNCKARPTMPS